MNTADLRRLFEYAPSANDHVAQALAELALAPSKCVRWTAHILGMIVRCT